MSANNPVLIATDMSDWARKAEARGAVLAKSVSKGEVILSYIQEESEIDAFLKFFEEAPDVSVETVVEGLQYSIQARARELTAEQGVSVTPVASVGRIADELQVIVRDNKASILVMGKHGHGYHAVPIIGNTPIKVIQGCPCPVLVVRNDPDQPYKRVLIPVEFTDASAHQVKQAMPFIPADAEVTLLHVFMPPTAMLISRTPSSAAGMLEKAAERIKAEGEETMKGFVESLGLGRSVKTQVKVGLPDQTILESVSANSIDLLVLGKKPRNRLQEYVMGSVVHTGLNKAECDVMITPAPDA